MNCDQVFDVLTRGPFPTGDASDLAVEVHLSECAECARLAEALRPAIELFEEAVTEEESRTLPGYWGPLTELPGDVTLLRIDEQRATSRVRGRVRAERLTGPLAVSTAWRLAAAVLLGFLAVNVVRELGWTEGRTIADGRGASSGPALAASPITLSNAARQNISLLGLSSRCFNASLPIVANEAGDKPTASAGEQGLNCCNACHAWHADPQIVPQLATRTALKACQECHTN